jgi:D-lyxose ketol-isomerase
LGEAEAFIRTFGFALPPFASWSPETFERSVKGTRIVKAALGWDMTDYGIGDFDRLGLVLFTLRNGILSEQAAGQGMCYAEKLLISREAQVSPMHSHRIKVEDIINRGGASLVIKLHGSDDAGNFAEDRGGTVMRDGIPYEYSAGEEIRLRPGESVTLRPGDWHAFWGDGGDVLIGEVSSVNDDVNDNIFVEKIGRFSRIEEDVAPMRLLVSDYEDWLPSD